jgi:titin
VFGGGDVSDIEVSDFNGDGLPDVAATAPVLGGAGAAILLNRPGLPLAPTIGSAQGSDHAATVSWTAPPSNDTYPITGYIVTPQLWQTYTTLPPTTFNSAATTETVTGLTNGSRYVFRVQAINAIGVGQYSGPSGGTFGTLVAKLPNPPTIGPATAGDTSATVSWTAPPPVGSAVTGYTVTPYVGAVAQTPTTFNTTATTQTITGLTNGTTYQFAVQAINEVGTGPASGLSNAVTPFTFTVPDAPTIGTATAGNGQAIVSWTAPVYDGGSPLNGYIVTPYVDSTALAPRQFFSTATIQTIKNLTNGTTYTFTVAATNAIGTGPESQHSNPVTPGP